MSKRTGEPMKTQLKMNLDRKENCIYKMKSSELRRKKGKPLFMAFLGF